MIRFSNSGAPGALKAVVAALIALGVLQIAMGFAWYAGPGASHYSEFVAFGSLFKGVIGIALGLGLLNLNIGCRAVMLFILGLGLPVIPLEALALVMSDAFASFVVELTGFQSMSTMLIGMALGFALFLWMFLMLMREDVRNAFEVELMAPAT